MRQVPALHRGTRDRLTPRQSSLHGGIATPNPPLDSDSRAESPARGEYGPHAAGWR